MFSPAKCRSISYTLDMRVREMMARLRVLDQDADVLVEVAGWLLPVEVLNMVPVDGRTVVRLAENESALMDKVIATDRRLSELEYKMEKIEEVLPCTKLSGSALVNCGPGHYKLVQS